jgi:hypothetical protein
MHKVPLQGENLTADAVLARPMEMELLELEYMAIQLNCRSGVLLAQAMPPMLMKMSPRHIVKVRSGWMMKLS